MKVFDAIVYIRQTCPTGTSLDECIKARAANGDEICRRLLAAEEAFTAPLEPTE